MTNPPFGHFQPSSAQRQLIERCRALSPSWLNKQKAQWIRRKVLKGLDHPLDLQLDQVRMRCHLDDNVSERGFVFMPWRFDAVERDLMQQHLPDDGVFIDVGANVGIYSCLALTQINAMGRVVSIEPNPQVAARLKFNLSATAEQYDTPASRDVVEQGASDASGEFELFIDDDNLGASSLHPKAGQSIAIECHPLLALLYQAKVDRVDVMKVDIEGAEDLALVPFLSQANDALLPNCLIIEHNPSQWQLPLQATLEAKNYRLFEQTRMNVVYMRQSGTAQAIQFNQSKRLMSGGQIPAASKQGHLTRKGSPESF